METNNQNLPPLSLPPLEETKKINYVKKRIWFSRYKYIIILIAIFLIISAIVVPKVFHKDVKNIKVSGNQLSMILDKQTISAELSNKKSVEILINNGEMTSLNTANFVFITMEKVRYLEGKYQKSFIYCLSDGEEEAKESLLHMTVITKTKEAENNLRDIMKLIKKGNLVVTETVGQELLRINGLKNKQSSYGFIVVKKARPEVYFLLDNMNIIKEKYQ